MYSSNHRPVRGRVLTADDSSVMRELVSASLEACGYSVEAVDSGYAALEASKLESFDAVILDVEMPGIDGLAVGRALRGDPRTCASMIAIHTSLDETVVRAGFDSYDVFFSKTCDVRLLGESIDRMIRERRRRSEDAVSPVASTGAAEGNRGLGREPQPN
jgi:CheY-like chemotaxis protein